MYLHNDIPRYIGKGYGRRYRVQEHMYCYAPQHPLFRYINKYKDEIQVSFLIENVPEQEAFYWERFYIATIGRKVNNTGPLLNITGGGDGEAGAIQSQEWIQKRLDARKLHDNFKHTEATKIKIRNTLMGRAMPEEQRLKMIGRHHSEETKRKMSESRKGRIGYWAGKTMSIETKNKMKQQQMGSKNAGAKLNEQIVLSMRQDHDYSGLNCKQLSNKYNISITQTQRIIKRISWKNI